MYIEVSFSYLVIVITWALSTCLVLGLSSYVTCEGWNVNYENQSVPNDMWKLKMYINYSNDNSAICKVSIVLQADSIEIRV